MKKATINIVFVSMFLTIIGFLADADPKEPNTTTRFVEFFAMTALVSVLIFTAFFTTRLVLKTVRQR